MAGSEQEFIQLWLNRLAPQFQGQIGEIIEKGHYDPYRGIGPDPQGFTWKLDPVPGSAGVTAAQAICNNVGGSDQFFIVPPPDSKHAPNVVLGGSEIVGISKLQMDPVPNGLVAGPDRTVTMNMTFPFGLVIQGDFDLKQECCQTTDGTTCTPDTTQTFEGKGTYKGVIKTAVGAIHTQITTLTTAPQTPDIVLEVTCATFSIKPDDLTITVTGDNPSVDQPAQVALNDGSTKETIVSQLNSTLNEERNLRQFGDIVTQQLQEYLSENSFYPYGPASASAVY